MSMKKLRGLLCVAAACLVGRPLTAVELASPFSSHMVLQQGMRVPVWGWAEPGETVTVAFAGQTLSGKAGPDRRWEVRLESLEASREPRVMTVRGSAGDEAIAVDDVVVGEVWLCGGQSNMERLLGATSGKPIIGRDAAIASADFPLIRQMTVAHGFSLTPKDTVNASWSVCSPATAGGFTAVGFFFARDLFREKQVPIGIINCNYGGSAAEAWMSHEATSPIPELEDRLALARAEPKDLLKARAFFRANLAKWFADHDPASGPDGWYREDKDTSQWETMNLPEMWEHAGHPFADGVGWFQKHIELPGAWASKDLELHLGVVDDGDATWVNGQLVGSTYLWGADRHYTVPASIVQPGENVITIRVLDIGNDGGFTDPRCEFSIAPVSDSGAAISLRGPWKFAFSVPTFEGVPLAPQEPSRWGIWVPGNLYNAMLRPLARYAIRGFTFYQGETNVYHGDEYAKLFPRLIADWRETWGEGDIPFLFVQIAPYRSMRPEIRQAQLETLRKTENTAMVVTVDCGDAEDIHPPDKEPVGARLALAARALAYGESIEYSGPVPKSVKEKDGAAAIDFDHVDGGLVASNGPLRGFEVAGTDGVFHSATATISGKQVVVSAPEVSHPKVVRYGWATVPDVNLFNRAGLPGSPFRVEVK